MSLGAMIRYPEIISTSGASPKDYEDHGDLMALWLALREAKSGPKGIDRRTMSTIAGVDLRRLEGIPEPPSRVQAQEWVRLGIEHARAARPQVDAQGGRRRGEQVTASSLRNPRSDQVNASRRHHRRGWGGRHHDV